MWRFLLIMGAIVGTLFGAATVVHAQSGTDDTRDGRLITVFDKGEKTIFISRDKTIGDALRSHGITLDTYDAVEPSTDEEMVAPDYRVNIYRARPITVVDGPVRTKIMTPYQSTERIAKSADIALYPEDRVRLQQSDDFLGNGAGLTLTIDRAVTFTLDLYGKKTEARTHLRTVGEMLKEKGVKLGANDRLSVIPETQISAGMEVRVWREGKQTIAEDQPIPFTTELVYDADRPVGYRAIQTPGVPGVRSVTYEIEIKDGKEISRQKIAQIDTAQPKRQQLAIGIQGLERGLTRSRGALFSTDSHGVVHRETYYDLDMGVVMGACGQGGKYSVRFDGMKIDAEGYILIAANYARYPKCSIVETSAGPGRVYDTGGFVSHHPDGFDLATDWSNNNGR